MSGFRPWCPGLEIGGTLARILGEVTCSGGYNRMIAIFRERFAEIGITGECCDLVAGLASGHTTALLTQHHFRRFGPVTLGAILGVLGIKFIAVVDEEQWALISKRLPRAKIRRWDTGGKIPAVNSGRFSSRSGRSARLKQILTMSAAERRRSGRNAIAARWAKR